MSKQEKYIKQL